MLMINIIFHTLCPLTSELWYILYTPLCGDTGSENTFKNKRIFSLFTFFILFNYYYGILKSTAVPLQLYKCSGLNCPKWCMFLFHIKSMLLIPVEYRVRETVTQNFLLIEITINAFLFKLIQLQEHSVPFWFLKKLNRIFSIRW